VELAKTMFSTKEKIHRAIEAKDILYTYVSRKGFDGRFFPSLKQLGLTTPPRDKIVIFGDGNAKVVLVKEKSKGKEVVVYQRRSQMIKEVVK
jgi:hypothetical protein